MLNYELFKKDYFTAWEVRNRLVRIYKNCYRYCIQNDIEHNFDQYGYIKKDKRYISVDEIEAQFGLNVKDVPKMIEEIRKMNDEMRTRDLHFGIGYRPDLMNAMYPHVHWAYHCANNPDKYGTPELREKYYCEQNMSRSQHKRKKFIEVEFPKIYHRKWDGSDCEHLDENDKSKHLKGLDYMIFKAEELLEHYGETCLIGGSNKRKIVFFTGSGISKESGISTFRDKDGLWEQYPVQMVASAYGWYMDPIFVNEFYNELRKKYVSPDINGNSKITPNSAHKNIIRLAEQDFLKNSHKNDEEYNKYNFRDYDITIITQNVDSLHEQARDEIEKEAKDKLPVNIIHLHGELMKMCADGYKEDTRFHVDLPYNDSLEFPVDAKVKDIFRPINEIVEDTENTDKKILIDEIEEHWNDIKDKRMRPYIVFFGEDVPNMGRAIKEVETCDIFVVIGTSLNVYPAASLLEYVPFGTPIIYIDPNPAYTETYGVQIIKKPATTGMMELINNWKKYVK